MVVVVVAIAGGWAVVDVVAIGFVVVVGSDVIGLVVVVDRMIVVVGFVVVDVEVVGVGFVVVVGAGPPPAGTWGPLKMPRSGNVWLRIVERCRNRRRGG